MSRAKFVAFAAAVYAASALPAAAQPRDYQPFQVAAPQSYYLPDDGAGVAARRSQGVRLNFPFAWDNNDQPPRAYQGRAVRTPDARTWYIPAPAQAPAQQRHASVNPQGRDYYYPRDAYQPDMSAPRVSRRSHGGLDPRWQRQMVNYRGSQKAGTVIIDTEQRYLFLILGDGMAMRYGIGVGRPGFEWAGTKTVTRKAEWPDWTPPDEMLERRPDLPRYMPGGPENPLGARALYLGSSLYRIHGTNEPQTIGKAVSSGCIRMVNDDVIDLYNRVRVGTKVVVI